MKKCNTNLHFAILAVVTVGFLLWHSIAIFNLEQDLQTIQNNTTIPTSFVIPTLVEKSQDDTQISSQGRDDTGTDTENTDSQILYNEDGSIDTSNWKTYTNEEYGFSVKYPISLVKMGVLDTEREKCTSFYGNRLGDIRLYGVVHICIANNQENKMITAAKDEAEKVAIKPIKDVTIDGKRGFEVTYEGMLNTHTIVFYNDLIFDIFSGARLWEQIEPTFKFTE